MTTIWIDTHLLPAIAIKETYIKEGTASLVFTSIIFCNKSPK